jgi:glyoxylase-like metal-dependent hydrolase (beta-lactamase superfamily II)
VLVPCPTFLIRHPGAGPVMVDTGLHPSIASDPRQNFGRSALRVATPEQEPGQDVPAQLRKRGIEPSDVGVVVMTHLHVDHASAISEFPDSTFVLSEAEWIDATSGSRPAMRGYRPAHYDFVFDYRTIDFGRGNISSYASFGRTFDLFGDGSVRLAYTPGHTAGHICLHAPEQRFLLAGDHVLDPISPNVSLILEEFGNPLGDYLDSLHRIADLAPRVSYGGHGETVAEPAGRARAIAAHHDDRLERTRAALGHEPRSGYEVSLSLFGSGLPPIQRRFAVAETLSHLERLVVLGRAARGGDGRSVTYTGAQPGGRDTA